MNVQPQNMSLSSHQLILDEVELPLVIQLFHGFPTDPTTQPAALWYSWHSKTWGLWLRSCGSVTSRRLIEPGRFAHRNERVRCRKSDGLFLLTMPIVNQKPAWQLPTAKLNHL